MKSVKWHRPSACYSLDVDETHAVVVRSAMDRKEVKSEVVWEGDYIAEREDLSRALIPAISAAEQGEAFVVGAMPVSASVARRLTTPFASAPKARKVLPSLLDIQLPFPVEDCICQFLDVRRTDDGVSALALAARRETVVARLEKFRDIGLEPEVLDHEGLAIWTQSVGEFPVESGTMRVVACVGMDHSVLVLGRGADFEHAHHVQVGLADLERELSGDSSDSFRASENFARRVQRVVRAHLPEASGRNMQWVWTGAGAEKSACVVMLRKTLGFNDSVNFVVHEKPGSFLARALGWRVLRRGAVRCDFRVGTLVHPRKEKRDAVFKTRVAVAYLAFGLLLCGMNMAWQALVQRRDTCVQSALNILARELSGISRIPYGQEVLTAQRALVKQKEMSAPFLRAFDPSLAGLLADVLGTAQKYAMTLDNISLRPDYVSIHGSSEKWDDSEMLVDLLIEKGFSAGPPKREDALADERVRFTINGKRP